MCNLHMQQLMEHKASHLDKEGWQYSFAGVEASLLVNLLSAVNKGSGHRQDLNQAMQLSGGEMDTLPSPIPCVQMCILMQPDPHAARACPMHV